MKYHSCQFPYCIRTALTVTCKKCGKWFCEEHYATPPSGGLGHDCEKVDTWQTAGPSLNAIKGLLPKDIRMKDGVPELHIPEPDDFDPEDIRELEQDPRKPSKKKPDGLGPGREDWKKIIPK